MKNMKLWHWRTTPIFFLFAGSIPFVVYVWWGRGGDPALVKLQIKAYLAISFVVCLVMVAFIVRLRFKRIEQRQDWLIDAVNWNIERLKAHGLCRLPEIDEHIQGGEKASRWPWGAHHTEYLGHLEAAARKWWNLYDPSDPTTAPTNEMVADWLQSDRNLSREKARAIASMLRPDGLPTGPRR